MISAPRRHVAVLRPVCLAVALLGLHLAGNALPTGAQTVAGQVGVQTPAAGQLVIQQASDKAIVDWKTFSIAGGERVLVTQPTAQSVLLNRVVGSEPSVLLGQLQANGRVFLVNPRGIVFGQGSQVDAGGFLASTLDLSNGAFLSGQYQLTAGVGTPGSLQADGRISAPQGTVALVSPVLSVAGDIHAQRIGLASASSVRIDVEGDGLVLFNVRNDGLDSRLAMLGRLQADGGSVELRAQARAGFADTVLNLDGIVQARSLGTRDGRIVIDGGTLGATRVGGTLDASGLAAGEQGGRVSVLGAQVALTSTAVVDVSGATGGGSAQIGGGLHGVGEPHNAEVTSVAAGAVLRADATGRGDGGNVVVWSDRSTVFSGRISARGGADGGNGGFAEVSGKRQLDYAGTVDLRPANATGGKGTLLLDPMDLVIGNTADITGTGSTNDLTSPVIAYSDNPGRTSLITAGQVVAQLDGANVRLEATHDITVQAAINASNNAASGGLTLSAGNDINVNANITTRGGDVVLGANHDFGVGGPASGVGKVAVGNGVQVSTVGGGQTSGAIVVSGAAVTFGAGAGLVAGQDVDLTTGAAGIALAQVTAGGKIVVQADGGGITQTGALTVGADGSSFTTSGSSQAIDLSTQANVFNGKTVALQSTGDAAIQGDSLNFAASAIGGKLTASASTGGIGQTGALTIGADGSSFGTATVNQTINLATSANSFNAKSLAFQTTGASGDVAVSGDSLVFAASSVGGKLTAAAIVGGISQTGVVTVGADGSSFTTTGASQSIDLSTSTNVFNGRRVALQSAGDAAITGDALNFAASGVGGKLIATARTGGIAQSGALTIGADGSSFTTSTANQTVDLATQANAFNGKSLAFQTAGASGDVAISGDALNFATSTIGGKLTATASTGGMSQTGVLTVGADGSSLATTGASQSIDLSTSANVFNGRSVALQSSGDAAINGDALNIAASHVGGKLTATARTGGIVQSGALTIGADGSNFTTSTANQTVDLATQTNTFNGKSLAFHTTGAGGNVAVSGDALVLGSSNVGGKLIATATVGGLSQTGALTVGADGSSFTTTGAGQSIDLSSGANVFNGRTVALQSTGNAAITGDALNFAVSHVGGKLTAAASTGNIAQSGALTIGADGSSFTTATANQAINLATQANAFNGKSLAFQTAGASGDVAVGGDALNFATSTLGGKLTATASTGGVSQTGVLTVGADGSSFTTTGASQSIDLSTSANVFNGRSVALQSTGDAAITGDALNFAASHIGGKLTATALTGSIAQGGALTIGTDGSSFTTSTANQTVNLATQANAFNGKSLAFQTTGAGGDVAVGGDALKFATSTLGGKLTATATTGGITQVGPLTVGADGSSFTTSSVDQTIDLGTRANVFNGKTLALQTRGPSGDAAVRGDALTFAASTVGGRLLVTSASSVTQTGALTVAGATVLTSNGSATVVLDNAANDFSSVQLGSASTGSIASATVVDRNDLTLGGDAGALRAAAGGALTLSGGRTGSLDATAQTGIAQTASLSVQGSTVLTGAPGMSIDLATQGTGNSLHSVQFAASGSGSLGTVQVRNLGDLTVGGDADRLQAATAGALTLAGGSYRVLSLDTSAGQGAVTQTGRLRVSGQSSIVAGSGGVALTDATNDFTLMSIASAGDARIADANDLQVTNSQFTGQFALGAPGTILITGTLSGSGSLAMTGAGTLLIQTAQPYTGGTVVQTGTLALDGAAAQAGLGGPISVGAAGRLDLRHGAAVANPVLSLGGTLANSVGSGTLAGAMTVQSTTTIDVAGTATGLTVSGVIGDGGAAQGVTKTGAGSLTLTAANTYTGPTQIGAGTVVAAGGNGSATTFAAGSALHLDAGAGLTLAQDDAIGPLSGAGTVGLGSHTLGVGTGSGSGSVAVFSGVIAGSGGLTKLGAGTQVLSGGNLFTGATTVLAGTLQVAHGSALADGSAVTVAAGGSLNLADDETIGSLAGAGSVQLNAQRLTLGVNGSSTDFSGTLAGAGGLSKIGTGTFTLSGSNSFTGDTLVNAGTVRLGSPSALAASDALTVAGGATVDLGAALRIGSLDGAGRVALNAFALDTGGNQRDTLFSGTLDGAGTLTKSGTGVFTLAGTNVYTGATQVAGGTLVVTSALPATTALGIAAGGALNMGTDITVGSLAGAGQVALNGHALAVGGSNADTVFDGAIGGAGNLVKQGSGTLVLGGPNTYAGSTSIRSGTLAIGDGGAASASGSLGTGAVTNNGTLRFQRSDAAQVDNPIGGSGVLVVAQGSVTLTNTGNAYTGDTVVQGGELITSGAERLPDASTVRVAAGARLTLGGNETAAALLADGDVTVHGDVTTAGNQSYLGNLTVQSATGVRLTAAALDARGAGNQLGAQPLAITADTAQLVDAQDLVLGSVQLAHGGQITAPKVGFSGNLSLAQGSLGVTATAVPDAAAAVTDPTARVPDTGKALAIAGDTLTQSAGSVITVAAGAQLNLAATGGGSVLLAQDANSFAGTLSVLSGPAFGTAWSPNVQGAVGIQSAVNVAGSTVTIGGAGIEADTISIRADRLSTTGTATLAARLPFDNVQLGTIASLPSMLLELTPAAFQIMSPFGTSSVGISVQIGSRLTGNRSTGLDAGYLTVRPKNGAQGSTAVFLAGPNSEASVGGYRFFQDGAGRQSEIPVFYNNVLPQTPQVSGALSSVAAVGEAARKERFEETVRTENVAVRLRSGVIAEVGPGRPATVGTEGAKPPEACSPNRPNALTCN